MSQMATPQLLLNELQAVKAKVFEIDIELHHLREDFLENSLSIEERQLVAEALEEERQGKTIPFTEVKKKLRL